MKKIAKVQHGAFLLVTPAGTRVDNGAGV